MNDEKRSVADDELDVEALAGKLYRISKKAIGKILYPFAVLMANRRLLVLGFVLGIVSAVVVFFMTRPLYRSSFTLKPANRSDLFFFYVSHNLEQAVQNNETKAIQNMLHCSESMAQQIAEINVQPRWVKPAKKDTLNSLIVELVLKDPRLFDTIQKLYLHYIESAPYYARIRHTRESFVNLTLAKLRTDMKEIDSLKKVALGDMQPRGSGGFVFGEPLNPIKLYEEALSLYKQEISYTTQQQYLANFEVVNDCLPVTRPFWPNLPKLLVLGCGFWLLLGMIMAWFQRKTS